MFHHGESSYGVYFPAVSGFSHGEIGRNEVQPCGESDIGSMLCASNEVTSH